MERPIFQPVGTLVEELDTPALVVDLDVMERNIRVYQGYFLGTNARVRPVVTSHLSPQVARLQLAAPGAGGGVAVTTVGEAQVFANAGFDDILVANQMVTASKINRLCALTGQSRITVAADNPDNVDQLSQLVTAAGAEIGVLVEIEAGMERCGVAPGPDAVTLAKKVQEASGLRFEGIMASVPGPTGDAPERRREATLQNLQAVLDAKDLLESAGLSVDTVSIGGAHCQSAAGDLPAVTEVRAGRYPLMDVRLLEHLPDLALAAHVVATVISHPVDGLAVVDAGHKATGPDQGLPALQGPGDAKATRFSAEHGILELSDEARRRFSPGQRVWLAPYELAACVNQYDYIRAVRDGKLEGFWPLPARGRFA